MSLLCVTVKNENGILITDKDGNELVIKYKRRRSSNQSYFYLKGAKEFFDISRLDSEQVEIKLKKDEQ